MMKEFEAYTHICGTIMVKAVPEFAETGIDSNSPFVHKYLGKYKTTSLNKARAYFKAQNGGSLYVQIDDNEKKRNFKKTT
jgi:hypothetical protein